MLGAREHYAPIAMAEQAGWLRCFVTDLWSPWATGLGPLSTKLRIQSLGRFADRYCPAIPSRKVRALTPLGLRYKWMRARAGAPAEMYTAFERVGSRFGEQAARFLTPDDDVFFGFSSANLETLQRAAELGIRTVLDQIDPGPIGYQIVSEEETRFPHLANRLPAPPKSYFERIAREWAAASAVLVNSEWSKRALLATGVPEAKLYVAPLAFQASGRVFPREPYRDKLRVLWLGTLSLMKGLPYALEAAEKLMGAPVRFTFAGPCEVVKSNLRFPGNAEYVGPVTRSDVARLYRDADVFLFPTLSDGFGLTQLEAMAYGLPVIATRCCASVVEDGRSGMLVEPRDPLGIAESVLRLVHERDLLPTMSHNALSRSKDFQSSVVWRYYADALTGSRETGV